MRVLDKPLVENVDYLLLDDACTDKAIAFWPVNADSDCVRYLCRQCRQVTADHNSEIEKHFRQHQLEQVERELAYEALQLLPDAIRAQLLRKVKAKRSNRYGRS